jgi:hypothetical protein
VSATCPPGHCHHGVLLATVVVVVVVVVLVALGGDVAVVLVAVALGGDVAVMLVAVDVVVTWPLLLLLCWRPWVAVVLIVWPWVHQGNVCRMTKL